MQEKITFKPGIGIYARTLFTLSMIFGLVIAIIYSIKSRQLLGIIPLSIIVIPSLIAYLHKLFLLITYKLEVEIYEDKFIFKEKNRSKTFHIINSIKEVEDISHFWEILDFISPNSMDWLTRITSSEIKGRTKQDRSVIFSPSQPIHPKKLNKALGKYLNEKS